MGKRVKRLPDVNEADEGFDFLPVGLLDRVQDVDDAGSIHRPLPLCDTARGKLIVYRKERDWPLISSQSRIMSVLRGKVRVPSL